MVMVDYLLVNGLLVLLVGLFLLASSCSTLREILSMIEIIKSYSSFSVEVLISCCMESISSFMFLLRISQ